MASTLYLHRLTLKDIRCFERLTVNFDKPGESIVLIGDNGEGKSTVLRSLAMGICDQSSASALFRELHGEYVRTGCSTGTGTITVDLKARGPRAYRYRIVTTIKSLKAFERVDQELFQVKNNGRKTRIKDDKFPWERIFASGYGAGIRVQGTSDFDRYLTVDSVYPLFRYDELLQNPELVVRRLLDAARRRGDGKNVKNVETELKTLIAKVLQLPRPNDILFEPNQIYVKTSSGKVAMSGLADGFRGTATWVLDLISWWFVYRQESKAMNFHDVHGIVLIDEIEQHLHPRWQRNIIRLLTESFPNVQFIATTHSPLVASGCEGIPVHRLAPDEHSIEHPFGWLVEHVYLMMGLEESSRPLLFRREVLDRVRGLDLRRIRGEATKLELRELRKLESRLSELPGADPVRAFIGLENIRHFLKKSESEESDKSDA